jgi:predicted ribosome quality control (RQC) complex YloA/Tae2 family protein
MYSSFWVYQIWANYLFTKIHESFFIQAISYDKDSLYLFFIKNKVQYSLELKFIGGELFILESDKQAAEHKNKGQFQFKEIESQRVKDIGTRLFDRLLFIEFDNGFKLWFKGFGRFGNVILESPIAKTPENLFRLNIKADWEINLSDWNTLLYSNLDQKVSNPSLSKLDVNNYQSIIKSVSIESLIEYNFDPNFFNLPSIESQTTYLYRFFTEICTKMEFHISQKSNKMIIDMRYINIKKVETNAIIDDLIQKTQEFIRWYFFDNFKNSFLDVTQKRIKQDQSLLKGYQKRTLEITERRSYREIGDLILAHAHSIKKGVTNALLTDYYTNQRIRIKLDENLNAAENAQKYYRKAKNEFLELEKLKENITALDIRIEENTKKLALVQSATAFSDIKSLQKKGNPSNVPPKKGGPTLPYKQYEYIGYEIWVGKNAKSNDELIRLSSKNDLWLHVKDFTGSHVIIKQKGREYSKDVIKIGAQLAAFHSKAKHQSLVQVQFTMRKFVSKPKKAMPGEVNVLQESFVDVEPKDL